MTYTHDMGSHYESPYSYTKHCLMDNYGRLLEYVTEDCRWMSAPSGFEYKLVFCHEEWKWTELSQWANNALAGTSGHQPSLSLSLPEETASATRSGLSSWTPTIESWRSAITESRPENWAALRVGATDAVTRMWSAGKVTNSASASTQK